MKQKTNGIEKELSLKEYLECIKNLNGTKIKFSNTVIRTDYEDKSLQTGKWLTIEEYNNF